MLLVSIDPGVHMAGVAIWRDGKLVTARLLHEKDGNVAEQLTDLVQKQRARICIPGQPYPWEDVELAIEVPQTYDRQHSKGAPEDIERLNSAANTYTDAITKLGCKECARYYPKDWKGQVPKDVMIRRIKGRLKPEEKTKIVSAGSLTHNIMDGVGIGLKRLGRLEARRG